MLCFNGIAIIWEQLQSLTPPSVSLFLALSLFFLIGVSTVLSHKDSVKEGPKEEKSFEGEGNKTKKVRATKAE